MRTPADVEGDISEVKRNIRVNDDKLENATTEKSIEFYQEMLKQLNAQLTELLKERNNLGIYPT
jgi:hypothetical protein